MRHIWIDFVALLIVAAGVGLILSIPQPTVAAAQYAALDAQGDATRGKTVFYAGGCASCHATPGQPDALRLGGGLVLASPVGKFHVPNISPDKQDGIGAWSAGDLANAMLAGLSPKGEHYYPAFPYTTYAHAKIEDVADLMAFLRTLEPVAGKAPEHELPFPFNIRRTVGLWKRLFLNQAPIVADAARGVGWNRGHYLVAALGHCAECHSPRNPVGGIVEAQRYAGGPNLEGKGWVPNITQAEDGLAKWSQKDIEEALNSGLTPEFNSLGGSMAAVVRNTSQLPAPDRAAIAEYIKSLPPAQGPARVKTGEKQAAN